MAIKLGDAFIALTVRDDTDRQLIAARSKFTRFLSDLTTGISQGLGQAIAGGIGRLITAGLAEVGKSIEAAEGLNRELRRVSTIFGESADDIRAWASTASTSLGLTERAALGAASSLGNLFVQLGATSQEASTLSQQMVEAARDIAAFNGANVVDVLETFQAAFRGEYDSLQRFLPAVSDAAIKQQALADTGKEVAESLTLQEKALATQTLILNGAALAAGSYTDSLETAQGQQEEFTRRIEDGAARLGQVFLPIKRVFFEGLNDLLDLVAPYGENILESFASGLARGLVALTPFFAQLRAAFVYWLQPGSPPRLLKELTEWGKSAMEEYLHGWTLADFDALRSVSGMIENVVRSFAASGDIKETDLVSRIFGTKRTIAAAVREFRDLGQVSEATLSSIADAAGPAGTEVAGLVRQYFELQRATQQVSAAQDELNAITRRYSDALNPINEKLEKVRSRQREVQENQELEELGDVLRDRRTDLDDRELARLRIQEIGLERQARAIESEQEAAVDAVQAKIDAAQKEADAQKARFDIFQQALEQQTQTNALIAEEIDLRTRLANEALAEEERRRRELEQLAREEAASLERLTRAQLGYRLQLADTEGDLAIMREELAKVEEGSAEYFDILTQIAQLEEKLAKERAGAGGGGALPIFEGGGSREAVEEATGGFKELEEALKGVFGAFKGEGPPAQLNPVFKDIIDTIGKIDDVIVEVTPTIQGFIDLIMGKEVVVEGGGSDPFGDNFWLAGIVPFLRGTLLTLQQILDGDWAALWQRFKYWVDTVLNIGADDPDGTTLFFYSWLKDTVIPLFEGLADVEWANIWTNFTATVKNAWDTAVDYVDAGLLRVTEAFQKLKDFYEALKEFVLPGSSQQGPGYGQDPLPPSNFSSLPGGTNNGAARLALASGTTTTNNLGPITLVFNAPVTPETGRQTAADLDTELRQRGWAPT